MIEYANENDLGGILKLDKHINEKVLQKKIQVHEVYIIKENATIIGTLRYSLFWDNMPFLNMLYIHDKYHKNGLGSSLLGFWEQEMKMLNYSCVMTSTQANENAQHFFRKHAYIDIGGFVLPNEPLEIILFKKFGLSTTST